MARNSRGGRRRFGYDGMGTDLVVFVLIFAAGIWGIHYWNGMPQRPFHLGPVPLPGAVSRLPAPIRDWLNPHIPAPRAEPPVLEPSPVPTSADPAAAAPPPTPSPAPSAELIPTPMPRAEEPSPAATALKPSPSPEPKRATAAAAITKLEAKVTDSPHALQASATALAEHGGILYLGLPDGGIAICNPDGKVTGTVVRLPASTGGVRAITAGADGTVWWLAGTSGPLYSYRPKGKTLRSFDLSFLGPGAESADGLASLPGQSTYGLVILLGKGTTTLLNGDTGAVEDPAGVLPANAVNMLERPEASAIFAWDAAKKETELLALAGGDSASPGSPASLALWTTKSGDRPDAWTPQSIDGATAPPYSSLRYAESGRSYAALGPGGIALLAKPAGGQTLASCKLWVGSLGQDSPLSLQAYDTLPDGVFGLWAAPDRIAMGRSGVWWVFGSTIFHAARPGGATEAYLPWNGAGDEKHGKIASLIADDTGLWVATDTGVRRIIPDHPTADLGYGGYVRVQLGSSTSSAPANPAGQKLSQLTQEWQGVPYKWGGDSKSGIDCSGYVCKLFGGIGVAVPRATTELANGNEGKRIRGELQYGDVLVFPGHCGMYIGNGWTTEALDAGVGKAAIWSRKNVVVRRFLK